MQLSSNLLKYLDDSIHILDCGIIITDLSNIIYANTSILYNSFNHIEESNYINKPINKKLSKIISKWSKFNCFNDDLFEMYNNTRDNKHTISLIKKDKTPYYAQSVLPIFYNKHLVGLFICFRTNRSYISSSIKPIRTTRNLVEKFLEDLIY